MKLAIKIESQLHNIEIVDLDEGNAPIGCIYNNADVYTDETDAHKGAQRFAFKEAEKLAAKIVKMFNGANCLGLAS